MEDRGLWRCVGAHKGEEREVDEQKSEVIDHHLFFDLDFSVGLVFCQEMLQFHVKLVKKFRSLFNKVKDCFDEHLQEEMSFFRIYFFNYTVLACREVFSLSFWN